MARGFAILTKSVARHHQAAVTHLVRGTNRGVICENGKGVRVHRFRWFVIAFATVIGLAPLSGVITAALMATMLGCEINDAAQGPCRRFGLDFGPLLSNLGLTAGLGEIAFPIVSMLLAIWGVIEVVAFLFRSLDRAK